MPRFKKFYRKIPRKGYTEYFTLELQVDNRVKDPQIKLIYQPEDSVNSGVFSVTGYQIIITKLSVMDDLIAEVKRYLKIKEAKKVAKSRAITRTKEAGTEKSL